MPNHYDTTLWLEEDQRKEGDAADIQVLIDFAFHAAIAASEGAIYNGTGEPEEIAKWVRAELKKLGFETKAVYDKNKCLWRWGVLVEK